MNPKYEELKKNKNLRQIEPNEIVFDIDEREIGFEAINCIGFQLYQDNYKFEIWYAEGQKSPHLHVKDIYYLDLEGEQLKKYKELFLKKYTPEKYIEFVDFSLCPKHLIAEENKPHFKYKTIKKLCFAVFNPDKENFVEEDLLELAKGERKEYKPIVKGSGITAEMTQKNSIIDIAKQFGLDVDPRGFALCPFHDETKPSLKFYEHQGRFVCFGCQKKGNIIYFYTLLKQLNPNFKYLKGG